MVFDGIQFLKDFRIPYATHGPKVSHGWVGMRCPFCHSHSDVLGMNVNLGYFTCWKCGKHSTLEVVKTLLNVPQHEARLIYSKYLSKTASGAIGERRKASADSIFLPPSVFTNAEQKYLDKRGLDPLYGDLRGGGITGDFAYRIVFPIYYCGGVVSATGRTIAKGVEPRYLTYSYHQEIIHHKDILYNIDNATGESVILVEGPIDAYKGGNGFVASFGVNVGDSQIAMLSKFQKVFVIRDNDDAGINSYKVCETLALLGIDVEMVGLSDFKDVGEMDTASISDLRKELGV